MLATLIIPHPELDGFHARYQRWLATRFGGWTAHSATGGWRSANIDVTEPVTVYDIAMDDTVANREEMRSIAREVQHDMDQEAVYLAFNTAITAEFIDARPAAASAETLTSLDT